MIRKKPAQDDVNFERWYSSYSIFMMLLFALFVVMWTLSQSDVKKFKLMAESVRKAFSGTTGQVRVQGDPSVNPFDPQGAPIDPNLSPEQVALQSLQKEIEAGIRVDLGSLDPRGLLRTEVDDRGLIVKLAAERFFEPGIAEVNPDLRPLLDRIGQIVAQHKREIRIEGHTDSVEGNHPDRSLTWDLSARRASWVARYWIERFKMEPEKVGIAGFAHYRPLTLKKSDWARASNRRVEVVILVKEPEAGK